MLMRAPNDWRHVCCAPATKFMLLSRMLLCPTAFLSDSLLPSQDQPTFFNVRICRDRQVLSVLKAAAGRQTKESRVAPTSPVPQSAPEASATAHRGAIGGSAMAKQEATLAALYVVYGTRSRPNTDRRGAWHRTCNFSRRQFAFEPQQGAMLWVRRMLGRAGCGAAQMPDQSPA